MRSGVVLIVATMLAVPACDQEAEPPSAASAPRERLLVFAAASTTDVLSEAGRRFEAAGGPKVTFSFDSSSNLAKQIKAGAPMDVFLSADEDWMDDIAALGLIQGATREDLLGNRLVLITPARRTFEVKMAKGLDSAGVPGHVQRIAVGDPSHVPAGRYARGALETLGWWESLEGRLLPTLDVRAALRLVEIGEADAGIVYATDAKRSDKVAVVGEFPAESHEAIHYPVAVCKNGSPRAVEFIRFLRTPEMKEVFEQAGFVVLPPPNRAELSP